MKAWGETLRTKGILHSRRNGKKVMKEADPTLTEDGPTWAGLIWGQDETCIWWTDCSFATRLVWIL
jgi:hypothetical protein